MRLLSLALLLLVGGAGLTEQSPLVIERLEISLWPEYDDPRLLVIYRGELAQEPKGPLTFAIPGTAEIHAVAYRNAEGQLLKSDWQILPSAAQEQLVVFTLGSRQFQFEYYIEITKRGSQRSFTFQFQSSRYEIKDLQIEVQQPLRSEDFVARPPLPDDLGTDRHGLSYFGRRAGAVPAGLLIEQQISYAKRDAQPSLRASKAFSLSWPVMGALALLAIGLVGITWYWWARRRAEPAVKSKTRAPAPSSASMGFCSRCGRAFRNGEEFCPKCGQPRTAQ